jgi:hypothetical protein
MTYSYNSLRDDANPNSKTNKNNGTSHRNEPQYPVYIALSVFRYVPYYTKQAIKNEIERLANNIEDKNTVEISKIITDSWNELDGLKVTSKINKHGSGEKINESYSDSQKNYQALHSITVAIEFIKEYIFKTGPLKDKMQEHLFNMITHFDNNNKIKTGFTERNEIAYDKKMSTQDSTLTDRGKKIEYLISAYNKINKKNKLKSQNATAQNATAQNATAQNATAQNATAQNATAQNATAQTPVKIEKPTHNENTRQIIGEFVAYQIIREGALYTEDSNLDIMAYFFNKFSVEMPEIKTSGLTVMSYCTNILNNTTLSFGDKIFDMKQKLNLTKFAENVVNHILDNNIKDKNYFDENRKKIGTTVFGKLQALSNIIQENKNGDFLTKNELASIIKILLDNKAEEFKAVNTKTNDVKPEEIVTENKKESRLEKGIKKALNFVGFK